MNTMLFSNRQGVVGRAQAAVEWGDACYLDSRRLSQHMSLLYL